MSPVEDRVEDPVEAALRLQADAAALGFDWSEPVQLWDKLAEEIAELREAETSDHQREELGDLMFMLVNIARHLKLDPAEALAQTNLKFKRRFAHVLRHLEQLPPMGDPRRLDAMEQYWLEAKKLEKGPSG